jgi:hypothetical protein
MATGVGPVVVGFPEQMDTPQEKKHWQTLFEPQLAAL